MVFQSQIQQSKGASVDITTIYYLIIYAAKFSFTGRKLEAQTTVKTLKCTTKTHSHSEKPLEQKEKKKAGAEHFIKFDYSECVKFTTK